MLRNKINETWIFDSTGLVESTVQYREGVGANWMTRKQTPTAILKEGSNPHPPTLTVISLGQKAALTRWATDRRGHRERKRIHDPVLVCPKWGGKQKQINSWIFITLFLAVVMMTLLNLISSLITATLPFAAAMCAHVIPFCNDVYWFYIGNIHRQYSMVLNRQHSMVLHR